MKNFLITVISHILAIPYYVVGFVGLLFYALWSVLTIILSCTFRLLKLMSLAIDNPFDMCAIRHELCNVIMVAFK
jgi:hypothetical protein